MTMSITCGRVLSLFAAGCYKREVIPRCVEVLLPRPIDHAFHYLVPEPWSARAIRGVRAVVPFGHELLTGLIVDAAPRRPPATVDRLRSVEAIIDETPLLTPELIALLRWTADYYLVPWGEVLKSALPPPLLPIGERRFHPVAQSDPPRSRRNRLATQIIELLHRHPKGLTRRRLIQRLAQSPQPPPIPKLMATLRRLTATGRIQTTLCINPTSINKRPYIDTTNPTISQFKAKNNHYISHNNYFPAEFIERLTAPGFEVFVFQESAHLGSDALYPAAASALIAAGRSLLILTPEIERSEQIAARLEALAVGPVIRLHSELSPSTRAGLWLANREAAGPLVVVGSRSALFAPLPNLGLIIVDGEADPLHKQEERPRLHARDIAIVRAKQAKIPVLLSGRVLSVETYWNCATGRYRSMADMDPTNPTTEPARQTEQERRVVGSLPAQLVDLRTEPLIAGLLTKPLIEALTDRLNRHEQSLLFVNRRGYAPSLICRDCGELIRCQTCRTGLTYHKVDMELRCRYCGLRMSPPTLCPSCRGHRIGPLGTGTQRVEEAVRRLFPQARVIRIDRDAPSQQPGSEGATTETVPPSHESADLIIGTQLCLHRPSPPRLSLVGVLDAEMDLSRPDFRAEERMIQLLFRLQGLLQPLLPSAQLFIQTRQPERPALQALQTGLLQGFYTAEIEQRKLLGYPPFSRLAALYLGGRQEAQLKGHAEQLAKEGRRLLSTPGDTAIELWGPIPALPQRRGGAARWVLLLKAANPSILHQGLRRLGQLPLFTQLQQHGTLQIEIDPI